MITYHDITNISQVPKSDPLYLWYSYMGDVERMIVDKFGDADVEVYVLPQTFKSKTSNMYLIYSS